jgi:hypothetical protein
MTMLCLKLFITPRHNYLQELSVRHTTGTFREPRYSDEKLKE